MGRWPKWIPQKSSVTIDWKRKLERGTRIRLWNSRLTQYCTLHTAMISGIFNDSQKFLNKLKLIFDLFNKRFYIFCIFRLTALKSFSRAVVFAIEAIDFRWVTYQNLRKICKYSRRIPKYQKIKKYRKYQNLRKLNSGVLCRFEQNGEWVLLSGGMFKIKVLVELVIRSRPLRTKTAVCGPSIRSPVHVDNGPKSGPRPSISWTDSDTGPRL